MDVDDGGAHVDVFLFSAVDARNFVNDDWLRLLDDLDLFGGRGLSWRIPGTFGGGRQAEVALLRIEGDVRVTYVELDRQENALVPSLIPLAVVSLAHAAERQR